MGRLNDVICSDETCDHVQAGVWVDGNSYPDCERCGKPTQWLPTPMRSESPRGEFYSRSFDMTFSSQSAMQQYAREHGFSQAPSADKHHGARNESHANLGKLYSYSGQKSRGGYSDAYGRD